MARIKLKFYDKEYIIEYKNREEVKAYFVDFVTLAEKLEKIEKKLKKTNKNSQEYSKISADYVNISLKTLSMLIKAGLIEHHKDDMPSDESITAWVSIIPNGKEFYKKLMSMVQDVVSSVEQDRKNLNWEVEEN